MPGAAAGLLRVGTLAAIWGSSFLWIKLSLRGFSPVQLTFGRLALGALVLVLVLRHAGNRLPVGRQVWGHLVVAALLANAVPYLLFGLAERDVPSNLAGAINATTPLWTLVLALAVRAERSLSPVRFLGLVLGFAGAVLILAPWRSDGIPLAGSLAALAASASYGASYVYMARFLAGRGIPPLVLSAAQLTAAAGWLTLATPFGGLGTPHWRTDAVCALAILGALGTGAAYVLNYRIITDDGPVLASTVTYLLPVVAVLLGRVALDEPLTLPMTAGVAVVLLGVALARRAPSPAPSRTGPSGPPGSRDQ